MTLRRGPLGFPALIEKNRTASGRELYSSRRRLFYAFVFIVSR